MLSEFKISVDTRQKTLHSHLIWLLPADNNAEDMFVVRKCSSSKFDPCGNTGNTLIGGVKVEAH